MLKSPQVLGAQGDDERSDKLRSNVLLSSASFPTLKEIVKSSEIRYKDIQNFSFKAEKKFEV